MSDQEPENNQQSEEASGAVTSVVEKSASESAPTASGGEPVAAPQKKSSSAVAWLALLLVIALAAGAAWVLREGQNKEAVLAQRVAELETISRQKQTNEAALRDQLQSELRTGLNGLEAKMGDESSRVLQTLDAIEAQLAEQQKSLARFSASDRDSWLLAETGHLLRLANQRLVMAADPVAAEALLNSADAVLRGVDDPALHAVRAAIASEVASLRALPTVDVEGIYLALAALIEQSDKLVIFELPQQAERAQAEAAASWKERLKQGYEAALTKLSDYIIIRRRDVPMQALMDPQWEGLVRQNLRMLLEQAQVALLSGNQTLYVVSLERAQEWVAQFNESDEVAARAISAELGRLAQLTIGVAQPDISGSQQALDDAIEQRLQSGGEQ